jgi:hypothetical protein
MRTILAGFVLGFCLVLTMSPGALAQPSVSQDSVMFVTNSPEELILFPINRLIDATRQRLEKRKILDQRNVAEFWSFLREHGIPEAGSGEAFVGMVVSAKDPSTEGVLVVQGNFDKERILEMISRRYAEHVNEHITYDRQQAMGIGRPVSVPWKYSTHRFYLPLRQRELLIVDMGNTILFSSHRLGQLDLLSRTITSLQRPRITRVGDATSRISYSFEPTSEEKEQILEQLDTAYTDYREGRMAHRRGVKRFSEQLRRLVVDKKFRQIREYVEAMEKVTFRVDRLIGAPGNTKNMNVTLKFNTKAVAQAVKAGLVKHLVAEMKAPVNQSELLAFQNPRIAQSDERVVITLTLGTEQEQLQAFSIMAGYVARSILTSGQTPVVRRLKTLADRQAMVGRKLEQELAAEKARTSFFSLGRKFSLMYKSMQTRSNIRRCEDTYVELENEPKTLMAAVERMADVSEKNLDILDSLIEIKRKDFNSNKNKTLNPTVEMVKLHFLRQTMVENARVLIVNAQSAAFRKAAGQLSTGVYKKLAALSKQAGLEKPLPYRAMTTNSAGAPEGLSTNAAVSVDQFSSPTPEPVVIPKGTTLEQALSDYMTAYQTYTGAIENGDQLKIREAYEAYLVKFQIYQAIRARQTGNP